MVFCSPFLFLDFDTLTFECVNYVIHLLIFFGGSVLSFFKILNSIFLKNLQDNVFQFVIAILIDMIFW